MDNITHSLVGALMAQTRLKEWTPYATTTLIVGANLPDIDIVSQAIGGKAAYLEYHRGISHSLLGVLVLSLALGFLIFAFNQLRRRGKRKQVRLRGMLAVSLLGTFTHPILDFTNSYGIRPFLPVTDKWVYGDLVFIVDPYLWLILGGALFLLTSKTRRQRLLWAFLSLCVTLPILFAPIVGVWIKLIWLLAIVMVVAARYRFTPLPRGLAATALVVMVTYWSTRGVVHEIALARLTRHVHQLFDGEPNPRIAVLPTPTNPFVWQAVVETEADVYTTYRLALLGDISKLKLQRRARGLDDPLVQQALATPIGRAMQAFARFPIARVTRRGQDIEVILSDARFATASDMGWCALAVHLPASPLSPNPDSEESRRAIKGVVHVGPSR